MRASAVVKRQCTRIDVLVALLLPRCHLNAAGRFGSGMRRSRHWRTITPISISAMFSQLPCLGV